MTQHDPGTEILLRKCAEGDSDALNELFPRIYSDLRRLARIYLRKPGVTLQPTALVNDAFVNLLGGRRKLAFGSRAEFFASAAQLLRSLAIDRYRARNAQKRGGHVHHIDAVEAGSIADARDVNLIDLDRALTALAESDPVAANVVEQRYYMGLSIEETAQVLDLSIPTVNRKWSSARAWLRARLNEKQQAESP